MPELHLVANGAGPLPHPRPGMRREKERTGRMRGGRGGGWGKFFNSRALGSADGATQGLVTHCTFKGSYKSS